MDVHLLVYDLSQGLARQMSLSLLGFHLDAIYHTAIQLDGREYVYDGNIVAIRPGSSHLGQPMQTLHLGGTERKFMFRVWFYSVTNSVLKCPWMSLRST